MNNQKIPKGESETVTRKSNNKMVDGRKKHLSRKHYAGKTNSSPLKKQKKQKQNIIEHKENKQTQKQKKKKNQST